MGRKNLAARSGAVYLGRVADLVAICACTAGANIVGAMSWED